jgi:hypothetical protein
MLMRRSFCALAPLLLAGCVSGASAEVTGALRLRVGSLDRRCWGGGSSDDEHGRVTWFKHSSDDGEVCHVSLAWTGDLVDFAPVREVVDEQLRRRGGAVEKVELAFQRVEIAFQQVAIEPPLAATDVELRLLVGDRPLAGQRAVLGDEQLAVATGALRSRKPLEATAYASFNLPVAAIPDEGGAVTLSVEMTTSVDVGVRVKSL